MPKARVDTPSLTEDQLTAYLEHVKFPSAWRRADRPRDMQMLNALHVHHITAIPYENLGLHYVADAEPRISTDPGQILAKILHHGRGGYCMEGNLLFNAVLRALGFNAYLTGARIRIRTDNVPAGPWTGIQHVVNIVTFDMSFIGFPEPFRCMSDVAFGGDGPTRLLQMILGSPDTDDEDAVQNLGTQQIRLAWQTLEGAVTGQHWWVYQYRNRPTDGWNSYYAFQEAEYLWCDFEVMNWFCATNPQHFHRVIPVAVKFIDDGSQQRATNTADTRIEVKSVIGKTMLADRIIKQNMGGRTQVLVTCGSEQERLDGLHRHLNMTFTPEEQAGIHGRVSEIV